jgi:hypothetical protein
MFPTDAFSAIPPDFDRSCSAILSLPDYASLFPQFHLVLDTATDWQETREGHCPAFAWSSRSASALRPGEPVCIPGGMRSFARSTRAFVPYVSMVLIRRFGRGCAVCFILVRAGFFAESGLVSLS